MGLIELEDAETGETILVDTASKAVRRNYEQLSRQENEGLHSMLRSVNVDCINISTDRPYVQELVRFFRMRERRR